MKYIKKPIVVDAFQMTNDVYNKPKDWPTWLFIHERLNFRVITKYGMAEFFVSIKTLEGEMQVSVDDWIIKGVNGEIYPCKPDIFEKTYEIVVPK